MRLPDPFTHPHLEGLGFEVATIVDNDPIIRDELPNGTVREVKVAAQYFGINITYPELYPNEYTTLDTFILESKRTRSYIDVLLPQYESFRVKGNPSATVIAPGLKGSVLEISNTGYLNGAPQVGDLFKLSTHPKVYKITSFKKESNKWTLGLYPDLRITTNGQEKPIFTGITFRTKGMNLDTFSASLDANGMYTGLSLNLRES